MNLSTILLIIGGLATLAGTCVAINEQKQTEKKQNQAQEKIINLSEELFNQTTGGDVIPKISPSVYGDIHPNEVGFDLINDGKYPIIDVSVAIQDLSYLDNISKLNYDQRREIYNKSIKTINIGTVPANHGNIDFVRAKYPTSVKNISFSIHVVWRNGSYTEFYTFERNSSGQFEVKSTNNNNSPKN